MKNVVYNITYGIHFNLHNFFLRTLATTAIDLYDQNCYAPWIMRLIKHRSNIAYQPSGRNHQVFLPPAQILYDTIYPPDVKIPDVVAGQSNTGGVHEENEPDAHPLAGQFCQPRASDTTTQTAISMAP